MLKLAREKGKVRVVGDESVSPTFTPEIAEQAVALAGRTEWAFSRNSGGQLLLVRVCSRDLRRDGHESGAGTGRAR